MPCTSAVTTPGRAISPHNSAFSDNARTDRPEVAGADIYDQASVLMPWGVMMMRWTRA